MSLRNRAWIAAVIGSSSSLIFFILYIVTEWRSLLLLQFVGFYCCWRTVGFESATMTDFPLITLPINAAIYSLFILALRALWSQTKLLK